MARGLTCSVTLAGFLGLCLPVCAENFSLTAFEWPPYLVETSNTHGILAEKVSTLLKSQGHELTLIFRPWRRALRDAREDEATDGILGVYPGDIIPRLPGLLASPAIMTSTIVLIEPQNRPIVWAELSDLRRWRIGIIDDYANTPTFDQGLVQGLLKAEPGTDDQTNLRKLAAGRLDLAVMDGTVFYHLSRTLAADIAVKLHANPRPLGTQPIIAALKPNERGRRLHEILRQSLGTDSATGSITIVQE